MLESLGCASTTAPPPPSPNKPTDAGSSTFDAAIMNAKSAAPSQTGKSAPRSHRQGRAPRRRPTRMPISADSSTGCTATATTLLNRSRPVLGLEYLLMSSPSGRKPSTVMT